ncbi:MAG: bifunctional 4-hydroxy-2-oxoglutarate aldolase/2-dehydro-3-deoxy-phosphogluconate aldolase [Colwellia sp.]|nr:bifunctional 4-hydroxy-2-oxoglutarate aldolase/2-dehydro-3-deoxy-phosphogluconate aldolase [Colwellia sp.]
MQKFSTLMAQQTLLPIITAHTVEQGVNIAKAMKNAGLSLVEVVLRTDASLEALSEIKKQVPGLIVGAGTVTSKERLEQAINANADFIVTPAVSDKLLTALTKSPIPVLPGVSNTGEILLAREYGYTEQKLFPASLAGGTKFISTISTIFDDVIFCPTGGITAENKHEYLTLNNVFAVGGTWISKPEWVEQKNWQAITNACRLANQ